MKQTLFFALLFLCLIGYGQHRNWRVTNYGYRNGLPDKYIYCAAQDSLGYMWFGTPSGLYRFNGRQFQLFTNPYSQQASNPNHVFHIYFDKGIFWLGGLNCLQRFNPYTCNYENKGLADSSLTAFAEGTPWKVHRDNAGKLWIGSNTKGWGWLDEHSGKFYISPVGGNSCGYVVKFIETENKLLVVCSQGLFDIRGEKIEAIKLPSIITCAEYEKKSKTIWLGTKDKGLWKFQSNRLHRVLWPELHYISTLSLHKSDQLWVAADELTVINPNTLNTEKIPRRFVTEFSYNNQQEAQLFTDREDNVWVCSFTGLSLFSKQNQHWISVPLTDPDTKATIEVSSYADIGNNTVAFSWYVGKKIGLLNTAKKLATYIALPTDSNINQLSTGKSGNLYILAGGKVYQYTNAGFATLSFPKPITSIYYAHNHLFAVIENGKGFFVVNEKGTAYYNINQLLQGQPSDFLAWPIAVGRNHTVLFQSVKGVYRFNLVSRKIDLDMQGAASFLKQVSSIAEDPATGHLWLATLSSGLYEIWIEKGKSVVKNYTYRQGHIPSDYCSGLEFDAGGCLWVNTLAGLIRYDTHNSFMQSLLSLPHGFKDQQITGFVLANHKQPVALFYGEWNVYNKAEYEPNKLLVKPDILSIKVGNEMELNTKKELTLQYWQNSLEIAVGLPVYNNHSDHRIYYKLAGADKNWTLLKEDVIRFSNLNTGIYTLQLKAANNDGLTTKTYTELAININPPWYSRWWFLTVLILFVVFIAVWIYSYRVAQVRHAGELSAAYTARIAEMEMRALRAQMNPHFIFNSLNSINRFVLKNEHFQASQYLTKFARLIRLILDHSEENAIALRSELDMLSLYIEMEDMRFENKFSFQLEVAENLKPDFIEIPSMLIQPYLENAIWHGLLHKTDLGLLQLAVYEKQAGVLQVTITDNGIGRAKAAQLKSKQVLQKKSFGMKITAERMALLYQRTGRQASATITDLTDENGIASGTEVVLLIPFFNNSII